jgi:hypothetical protein
MGLRSVVATAAAAVVVVAGCGWLDAGSSDPAPVPVPRGLGSACPDPSTAPRFPEGDLPAGATRVRLCPGPPLTGYDGSRMAEDVQAPADLLRTGVDRLVALVNRQDDADGDLLCNADAGPEVVYWFGYDDGEWRAVQHGSYGCDALRVGVRSHRLGGAQLALAFTESLLAQRAEGDPPPAITATACSDPHRTPRTALARADLEVTSALRCVSTRPGTVRAARLPDALVQRVNAEIWPGVPRRSRRACSTGNGEWIEAVTAWGDRVAWAFDACGRLYALHGASLLPDERRYLAPGLDAALAALPLGPSHSQD